MLAILFLLCGCATELRSNVKLAKNQGADFTAAEITQSTADQEKILEALRRRAGLGATLAVTSEWDVVIAAGIEYADAKCEAYMGALVRLNRDKKTTASEIGLVGTAAAGVMAAAQSAARDIAMVAIAFGLASSTVDNLGGNVLYEIEPSSVRAMVKALQAKYKAALAPGYVTRPAAMNVIRGYAALCTPANIEAELNHAIKNAEPQVAAGDPASGRAPEVSNAATRVTGTYAPDDSSRLLNQFIRVNGAISPVQRAKLEAVMDQLGIGEDVDILEFINNQEYAARRLEAVKLLQLVN